MKVDYDVCEIVIRVNCECGQEELVAINSIPDFGQPFKCPGKKCGKMYQVDYKIEVKQVNE